MLTSYDIEKKIMNWETQEVEFKRESAKTIKETMVAFANDYNETGGGVIIIGVDPENHIVTGISNDMIEGTQRLISDYCRDGTIIPTIFPEIYNVNMSHDIQNEICVVVIEVKKSDRRPHRTNNICYIRLGPTTRKAMPDEEFELIRRSGRVPYDMVPLREISVDSMSLTKFEQDFLPLRVSQETISYNGRSMVQWAEALRFLVKEGDRYIPTIAAILLFGKAPQDIIANSYIDFIVFEGIDTSYPIINRQELKGTVDDLIKAATDIVERFMVKGYKFEQSFPRRKDMYEYPWDAIFESVANAVMHRDYEISRGGITIKMFDDRLEILSPGGLFGIVNKDNFGEGVCDYRNPTIALNLKLYNLVEKVGRGIPMIKRKMRENGSAEPIFEIRDTYVLVRLPAHPFYMGLRLYERGLMALERGEKDIARNLFKKATDTVESFPEAWASLGRLEALYGDVEESRRCFKKAIDENPQFERAYLEWGKIEEQEGNLDRSEALFRQGTEAIPHSAALWYSRALQEEKSKHLQKAYAFVSKALSIQPTDPRYLRTFGGIAQKIQKFDEAIEAYKKAIQYINRDDEKSFLWFEMMKSLIEMNSSHEKIKNAFESSYSLGYRHHELFLRYYRYLTAIKLHGEALNILEIANNEGVPIKPSLPTFYVGNLPSELSRKSLTNELESLFQKAGIQTSKIYIHTTRRFGIITVVSDDDIIKALGLKNPAISGKAIIVDRNKKR